MTTEGLEEATADELVHLIAPVEDDDCDMGSIVRVESPDDLVSDKTFIGYMSSIMTLATSHISPTCPRCSADTMPPQPAHVGTAVIMKWVSQYNLRVSYIMLSHYLNYFSDLPEFIFRLYRPDLSVIILF